MTWRERIVAARERGEFTEQDLNDASRCHTCAVAEGAQILGLVYEDLNWWTTEGMTIGGEFPNAVYRNDFYGAEQILDRIEDRVLQLKREAQP